MSPPAQGNTLASSEAVGDWREPSVTFMCTKGRLEADGDDECDCGYRGPWGWRVVFVFTPLPGHKRGDRIIRQDLANGWDPRPNDEGAYLMMGRDERCPICGDVERFDNDGEQVERWRGDHHPADRARRVLVSAFLNDDERPEVLRRIGGGEPIPEPPPPLRLRSV